MIDNTLMWKRHTEMIIPKFSVACFAVRTIKPFVTQDTLRDCLPFLLPFYYKLRCNHLGKYRL